MDKIEEYLRKLRNRGAEDWNKGLIHFMNLVDTQKVAVLFHEQVVSGLVKNYERAKKIEEDRSSDDEQK